MALKHYDKKLDYSYTYGIYPTIDLFRYRKDKIQRIILNTKGYKNDGYHELENLCKRHKIPLEYNTRAIMSISAKENTYAIGVFRKYQTELNWAANHVVLANPSNTGNIGTIIRTMLGLGFKDLAIIRPGVDIFDPKVVRSSMGSFFNINFQYFETMDQYIKKTQKDRELYLFMLDGAKPIDQVKFKNPFSLVFGNESQGLDPIYKKYGQSIYITHSKEIDSLNLSVAVSIGLYLSSTNSLHN